MKPYKVFFRDADDTLFDFRVARARAFERSFAEFDPVAAPEIFGADEVINKALWRRLE